MRQSHLLLMLLSLIFLTCCWSGPTLPLTLSLPTMTVKAHRPPRTALDGCDVSIEELMRLTGASDPSRPIGSPIADNSASCDQNGDESLYWWCVAANTERAYEELNTVAYWAVYYCTPATPDDQSEPRQ